MSSSGIRQDGVASDLMRAYWLSKRRIIATSRPRQSPEYWGPASFIRRRLERPGERLSRH